METNDYKIPEITSVEQDEINSLINSVDNNEPDVKQLEEFFGTPEDVSVLFKQVDWSQNATKKLRSLSNELAVHNSVTDYLQSSAASYLDDTLRATGISTAMNSVSGIQSEYNSLLDSFSNLSDLKGDFSSITDVFSSASNTLDAYANVLTQADDLLTYVDDALGNIENLADIPEQLAAQFDQISEMVSTLPDTLLDTISLLPESIIDNLMGMDILQRTLGFPRRIQTLISTIAISISGMQAPDNLKSAIKMVRVAQGIATSIQSEVEQLQQAGEELKQFAQNFQSNQFLGMIMNVAGSASFIEKPIEYNAEYPYNQAYTTDGGHIFEIDNTPDKERLRIQHKTGSSVIVQSDGSMITKVKKDSQLIIEKNGEIHVKGNHRIFVDGNAKIVAKGNLDLESDVAITASAPIINAVADGIGGIVNVTGEDINLMAAMNVTIGCAKSISLSALDSVWLSGKIAVNIDAPVINIGHATSKAITLLSKGTINSVASTTTLTSSGPFKITGVPLALN